jgi:hypothetical protein
LAARRRVGYVYTGELKMTIRRIFFIFISLFLLSSLAGTAIAIADDEILPIKSVPVIKLPKSPESQMLEFQGQGRIQRVGKDEVGEKIIVIEDRLFYLSDKIKYYDAKGTITSDIYFSKDKTVGFFYDKKRKLVGLYLTDD